MLSFFDDFIELTDRIRFNFDKILTDKKIILQMKNNDGIWVDILFTLKIFNTISFIHKIIQYIINLSENRVNITLIDEYFETVDEKSNFAEYKKLIHILYVLFSSENIMNYRTIKNRLENYDSNKSVIIKIIDFLLKFKIMGDQLQAHEADRKKRSLTDKKRILTTQDRVLLAFCLTHEEISFVSKTKIGDKYYMFYNLT